MITWNIPRRSIVLAVLVATALVPSACGDDDTDTIGPIGPIGPIEIDGDGGGIEGSGEIATESRSIDDVGRIVLRGEGRVVVHEGAPSELAVTADDDLLEYIETEVVDGALEIRTRTGVDIEPTASIVYDVVVPELSALELAGAGSIEIDTWATDEADVRLPGAGDITIGSIDATRLDVDFAGVGSIRIAGAVDRQVVDATGTGEYDAEGLESRIATVEAGGTTFATVWVSDTLDIDASGAATVEYYGLPTVDLESSELAVVTPLGARE